MKYISCIFFDNFFGFYIEKMIFNMVVVEKITVAYDPQVCPSHTLLLRLTLQFMKENLKFLLVEFLAYAVTT